MESQVPVSFVEDGPEEREDLGLRGAELVALYPKAPIFQPGDRCQWFLIDL